MKKVGTILGVIVLIGLIIFVSCKTLDDGHLRIDGVRIKLPLGALVVEDCESDNESRVSCTKNIKINDSDAKLEFKYDDFKENGYPKTFVATINGHEFFKKENLNLEVLDSSGYQMFRNFKIMDNYIIFTHTLGTDGRTTTLYAIDLEGKVILEEKEIDKDDMLIKDSASFISYEENVITVYASRLIRDVLYKNDSICKANSKDIAEAYYTYTLKNGKFTKKQTKTITIAEFMKEKGIEC